MFSLTKMRQRDLLDYIAVASALITMGNRLIWLWGQKNAREVIGNIVLLGILALFAALELKAVEGPEGWLYVPPAVAVPVCLVALGICALTHTGEGLLSALLGLVISVAFVLISDAIFLKLTGRDGFDRGTALAAAVAGLSAGCGGIVLFWVISVNLCSIWYLALLAFRFKSKHDFRNRPISFIPFMVLAVIVIQFPRMQQVDTWLTNLGAENEIRTINEFVIAAKAGTPVAANNELRLVRGAYSNTTPHPIFRIFRSNVFRGRSAYEDREVGLLFVVSPGRNKVVDVRAGRYFCGL